MKIPSKFKYKGHNWKVIRTLDLHHEDGTKCLGLCDTEARTIYIESSISKEAAQNAFLHELYHTMVHEARIPEEAVLTETVEDILAENFADLMTQCFNIRWSND